MNKIRLVALDMDGTLLDSQKRLPKDFLPWVIRHKEILTVISSGRQYYTLLEDFEPVKDDLIFIAENGALVLYHDQVIYKDYVPRKDAFAALEVVKKAKSLTPVLCGVKAAYMKEDVQEAYLETKKYYAHLVVIKDYSEFPEEESLLKIALYDNQHEAALSNEKFCHDLPENLQSIVSADRWMDIAKKTTNKGAALKKIQEHFSVSKEESMAFGDYMNDYDMLLNVGESYAMKNACEGIKRIAKHITKSNDEDGVMIVLRQFDK